MSKDKTEKREVDGIVECAEELNCQDLTIVTWNEERIIEKRAYKINVLSFAKFAGAQKIVWLSYFLPSFLLSIGLAKISITVDEMAIIP